MIILVDNELNKSDEKLLLSSLTLAFMGDAVYEIMVRKKLIERNFNLPASKLHVLSVDKVKSSSQSKAYDYIISKLNSEEIEIMKRGRNNNSAHYPKNAIPIEYRKATGLESLFGYWFINNEYEKLVSIFNDIYDFLER